jgi:hypothetical protein
VLRFVIVMLSVIMLIAFMLNVVMLSVIIQSVVVPIYYGHGYYCYVKVKLHNANLLVFFHHTLFFIDNI